MKLYLQPPRGLPGALLVLGHVALLASNILCLLLYSRWLNAVAVVLGWAVLSWLLAPGETIESE